MGRLLRGGILMLALCCPAFALAAPPTPQGLTDIQKLFGFDVLIDLVFEKQFDAAPIFNTLAPEKKACLLDLLRADMHASMGKSMGEMFVDQKTIADWMAFSLTSGGGTFLQMMRATVVAKATGQEAPDLAAAMMALGPAESAEVAAFMHSPAAQVMEKGFPEMPTSDETAMEQKFEQCDIVAGLI